MLTNFFNLSTTLFNDIEDFVKNCLYKDYYFDKLPTCPIANFIPYIYVYILFINNFFVYLFY